MKNTIEIINSLIEEKEDIIILGGHFPIILDPSSGVPIPAIVEDFKDNNSLFDEWVNHPYIGRFPSETFNASLYLIRKKEDKIVLLVNDWQFLPKNKSEEVKVNIYRDHFYKEFRTLPVSFKEMILLKKLDPENVILKPELLYTKEKNPYFFSETVFRKKFNNQPKFSSCELGSACAQEFLPFLMEMNKRTKKLIAFIPQTCKEPTTQAIKTARNDYGVTMDIISVIPMRRAQSDFWSEVWILKNGEYWEVVT